MSLFCHRRRREEELLEEILHTEKRIEEELAPKTPTAIRFKEIIMGLATVGGNTLVFTGTLSPVGAAFPAGTSFNVTSNDPAVLPTVDPTGLIVTVPLPTGWVESATTPLEIAYSTGTFTPEPSTSPAVLTATITPSAPPPTPTPTGILFMQTT